MKTIPFWQATAYSSIFILFQQLNQLVVNNKNRVESFVRISNP